MTAAQRKHLEKTGGRITTVADFLDMTTEDVEYVEMKVNLSQRLRTERRAQGLTQQELAECLNTGQARIAKAESCDASFDALLEALVALGLKRDEIGQALSGDKPLLSIVKDRELSRIAA